MGRYPQNDDASQPIDLHGLNRDAQRPGDQRNAVVLTRLLEHTAELRTATQLLSDRIEQLGRVLASRRPAN
jgi:hypothetical protein